jgi:predicted transposase/invertase (TIGR01784 family)
MKTDTLLYNLFQGFPEMFFELIGESPSLAEGYRFDSIEVKQIAFRLDGVFVPKNPGQQFYFLECQFQKDAAIYLRLIAQIAMYIRRKKFIGHWQAVILFARRTIDPGVPEGYQAFEASGQIQRFYLEDHENQGSLAFKVLGLLGIPKRKLKAKVEELLPQAHAESLDPDRRKQIMEMIETVLIAKFPKMSRQEIEAMFNVQSLRNTRVFQEGVEEGIEQNKLEMIPKLVAAGLSLEKIAEITSLSLKQVREALVSPEQA